MLSCFFYSLPTPLIPCKLSSTYNHYLAQPSPCPSHYHPISDCHSERSEGSRTLALASLPFNHPPEIISQLHIP